VATIVVALVLTPWVWIATGILIVVTAVVGYVVTRQVGAISWIELPEEFVIRKGRVLRSLVAIPYGRLQFVDVQSGPVARAYGIASLQIHTASPQSSGTLPGLPIAQAEELRTRLAALGEAQRAGL
jgi:membrane protein YdbS with pleckstrin-like domain